MRSIKNMTQREKEICALGVEIGFLNGWNAKMFEGLSNDECLGSLSRKWFEEIQEQIEELEENFHVSLSPEEAENKFTELLKGEN